MNIVATSRSVFLKRVLSSRFFASYSQPPPIEPEPGTCCDEGCESCVWLVYANELMDYYNKVPDSLGKVKKEIYNKIESPTVKAFVMMELAEHARKMEELKQLNQFRKKKKN